MAAPDMSEKKRQSRGELRILGAILGLSAALQLVLAPYQGFGGDLQAYLAWGSIFDAHPLLIYTLTGANYPPLVIYIFGLVELIYHGAGSLLGYSPTQLMLSTQNQFALLWFLAKLPMTAANTGSVWLIYRLARQAAPSRWSLLAALAYAVAPSMLLDGAAWGQTDGVPVFFILLAIICVQYRQPIGAGILLGMTLTVKPQPAIFVPILLLYILLTSGWRDLVRAGTAGLLVVLVICAPFLLPPHPQIVVYYFNVIRSFRLASSEAFNLWFLVFGDAQGSYQTPLIGSITVTSVGVMFFVPFYALALSLVWLRRSLAALFMAMALAAVSFFDVTTLQHERYLFQALAFLLLAAIHYRSFLLHFTVASVTAFVNMLFVAAVDGVNVANDPHFSPLLKFFEHHTFVIFMITLLNVQLLIGTSISCLAWLRRSGGNAADARTVPVPPGAHATAQQKHVHSAPERLELSGADAVDGKGSGSS
jgi:Gpi18-like mannosyltransferase